MHLCDVDVVVCHLQVSIPHRSFNEKEDNHQFFGPTRKCRAIGVTDGV
jgi:hypothetical protein